jgi:hypothetical protein
MTCRSGYLDIFFLVRTNMFCYTKLLSFLIALWQVGIFHPPRPSYIGATAGVEEEARMAWDGGLLD